MSGLGAGTEQRSGLRVNSRRGAGRRAAVGPAFRRCGFSKGSADPYETWARDAEPERWQGVQAGDSKLLHAGREDPVPARGPWGSHC